MKRIVRFARLAAVISLAALTFSCSHKPQKALRVVQYNVGAFAKEIENSIPMISDMMKELGADVVSLNELDSCNRRHENYQLADFAKAMGDWNYSYSSSFQFRGGGSIRRRLSPLSSSRRSSQVHRLCIYAQEQGKV